MNLALYWIDAFTSEPFRGNPAAVVPLERWLPDRLMQQIAFENGLAETAFFVPETGRDRFHLRWFTPAIEVDLCGHATLAAGHVLLRELYPYLERVTFASRSGPLDISKSGDRLQLDFPSTPVTPETDAAIRTAVTSAVGAEPEWLGCSKFDRFAVVKDAAAVAAMQPRMDAITAAGGRGLIVTARGDNDCDFVSRFFAPQSGVPEDPVTGSAHCALAPFWAARLGRTRLHARQLSARGGELWCELVRSSEGDDRVLIAGNTTPYMRGKITVPNP